MNQTRGRHCAAALLLLLGACGGGGGGSAVISDPVPHPPISPQLAAVPIALNSAALDSAQLQAVGAGYAASQFGFRGQGVTIGMLDSGLRASHQAFAGGGKLATGYNAFDGSSNVADDVDHGTGSASIAAGFAIPGGSSGVANLATILPIKVLNAGGGTSATVDAGLDFARSRAFIVNLSLTFDTVTAANQLNASAYQNAVASGLLIVVAAGNKGTPNPEWPARFAKETWANGQILAVGAADISNPVHPVRAIFGGGDSSAMAGDTAPWFLMAPGLNVQNAKVSSNTAYGGGDGTSYAAPFVAGAAAVIKGRWEFLTAQHIAQILLNSATPMPDGSGNLVNTTYGHGMLNLAAALQPADPVAVPARAGGLGLTRFTGASPAAAGDALVRATLASIVVDRYGRDYPVNLAQGYTASRSALAELPALAAGGRELSPGMRFSLQENATGSLAFGLGGEHFALEVGTLRPSFLIAAPGILALSEGYRAGLQIPLRDDLSGFAVSGTGTLNTALAGLSWHLGGLTLQYGNGSARESGSVLGGSLGALESSRATTTLHTVGAAYALGVWRLEAGADLATTRAQAVQMVSESFSVRLRYSGEDSVSALELHQPLRVSSGTLQLTLPTGLDAAGNAVYERQGLSLAPSGRELQAMASWQRSLDVDTVVGLRAFAIRQPGHDQTAPTELGLLGMLRKRF